MRDKKRPDDTDYWLEKALIVLVSQAIILVTLGVARIAWVVIKGLPWWY